MVRSFCSAASVNFGKEQIWERALGAWNNFYFPNRFKVFLFKYYSNILGVGSRVAHFNNNSDPSCSFCRKANLLPPPIESFGHVFFDCPEAGAVIQKFIGKFFIEEVPRDSYFNGNFAGEKRDLVAINLILDALRFAIWECRLAKNRISYYTIEIETINLLQYISTASNKISQSINQCNFINVDGKRRQPERPPP